MRNAIITLGMLCLVVTSSAWAGGLITLTDGGAEIYCLNVFANSVATYDLNLVAPINPSFGSAGERAVTNVSGFECKLVPQEGVIILGVNFPVPAIDAGSERGMVVGYSEPVPVGPNRLTVLATVDVFFTSETSFPLPESSGFPCYMGINTGIQVTESYPASIVGSAAFIDADDPDDPLVAADFSAGWDIQFRLFQDPAVPTEIDSWGRIKAMYR